MQLLGVLTGVLGHLVHPVLDHIQLGVDVVHGGLCLIPQLVGVVLQQLPDLIGPQIHPVQIAGDLVHEPVTGVHQMGGGVIQCVQGRWIRSRSSPRSSESCSKTSRHWLGSWSSREEILSSAVRMPWMCSLGFREGKGS